MKRCLFVAICIFLAFPVFTQTAVEIERLLDTDAVNYQQAAWLVLEAAEISNQVFLSGQADAFRHAVNQGWLPANAGPNNTARLDELSLLIMRAFEIDGGIFYTLTGSRHYAYRELVYRNIIQGRSGPAMAVSGDMLLFLVNRVLSFQEINQL
jgi:hypothetical protein